MRSLRPPLVDKITGASKAEGNNDDPWANGIAAVVSISCKSMWKVLWDSILCLRFKRFDGILNDDDDDDDDGIAVIGDADLVFMAFDDDDDDDDFVGVDNAGFKGVEGEEEEDVDDEEDVGTIDNESHISVTPVSKPSSSSKIQDLSRLFDSTTSLLSLSSSSMITTSTSRERFELLD